MVAPPLLFFDSFSWALQIVLISIQIVSSLAVDSSGARVLSGNYDYTVRMYDFQGINSILQSFRQIEPAEGHQVRSLSWSPTPGQFLCVTGSAQPKVIKPKLARPGRVPVITWLGTVTESDLPVE